MNKSHTLICIFVLAQRVVLCYSISVCGDIHRDFARLWGGKSGGKAVFPRRPQTVTTKHAGLEGRDGALKRFHRQNRQTLKTRRKIK